MSCDFQPSFDSIANIQQHIVNYVLLGIQSILSIFIFVNLVQLCRKSFSYRKDGIYQTIQFNVICLATLIVIILTRLCQAWFYKTQQHQANHRNSQNFTNLLAELTILFVNDIYLYGSIVWLRMIYQSQNIKKFKIMKKIIKIGGIYILNPLILATITFLHLFYPQNYITLTLIIILICSVLVQGIFIFASIKLIRYWDSFDFSQSKFVQYFKYILISLLVFSTIRILVFIGKIIVQFTDQNFRNFQESLCQDVGSKWAIIMFFYSLFVSILPIILFLFLFKYKINIRDQGLNMSNLLLKSYVN